MFKNNGILFLTPYYTSERGNTITARRLLKGLTEKGFRIYLVSMDTPDWEIKAKYILDTGCCYMWHALNAQFASKAMKKIFQLRNLPYVITLTGTDINFISSSQEKTALYDVLEMSSYIVVFNQVVGKNLSDINKSWKYKIKIIPQGVWLPTSGSYKTRSDFGLAMDKKIYLLPSCLRPEKNILEAVFAFDEAVRVHEDLFLVIAGGIIDTEYAGRVMEMIKGKQYIKWIGEVPHRMMRSLYGIAYAVMNTSRAEGQPQALMEGMSLGVPGIISEVPGNMGLFVDEVEVLYYQGVTSLTEKIMILSSESALSRSIGKNGKEAVLSRFDTGREIQDYADLYAHTL